MRQFDRRYCRNRIRPTIAAIVGTREAKISLFFDISLHRKIMTLLSFAVRSVAFPGMVWSFGNLTASRADLAGRCCGGSRYDGGGVCGGGRPLPQWPGGCVACRPFQKMVAFFEFGRLPSSAIFFRVVHVFSKLYVMMTTVAFFLVHSGPIGTRRPTIVTTALVVRKTGARLLFCVVIDGGIFQLYSNADTKFKGRLLRGLGGGRRSTPPPPPPLYYAEPFTLK